MCQETGSSSAFIAQVTDPDQDGVLLFLGSYKSIFHLYVTLSARRLHREDLFLHLTHNSGGIF